MANHKGMSDESRQQAHATRKAKQQWLAENPEQIAPPPTMAPRKELTPEQREARNAKGRARYAENPEAERERRRLQRVANPGYHAAYSKMYRIEQPEKNAASKRKWRDKNPEKVREENARRDARKRNPGGVIERITHIAIAERDGWKCHICGGKVTRKNWSIDHLIPLSKGGDHTHANVALAHLQCNRLRGAGRLPAQLRLTD